MFATPKHILYTLVHCWLQFDIMKCLSPKSWLTPPLSAECALEPARGQKRPWEQPPVATQDRPGFRDVVPKCMQTFSRTWQQPSPGPSDCHHGANSKVTAGATGSAVGKLAAATAATVELTLSSVLVATSLSSEAISELSQVQASRVHLILQSKCRGSVTSFASACSRCTGAINEQDAILFCTIFTALPRDDQVQLLHGLYSVAHLDDQTSPARMQWCFLGHPVCVQRLSSILGLSKRTLYKRLSAALFFQPPK